MLTATDQAGGCLFDIKTFFQVLLKRPVEPRKDPPTVPGHCNNAIGDALRQEVKPYVCVCESGKEQTSLKTINVKRARLPPCAGATNRSFP